MEDRPSGSNGRGRTESQSQPLILPFALQQLQDSESVSVKREINCCWSVYSVSCPDEGTLFTVEGIWDFGLKDNNGRKLAQIQRLFRCFTPRTLRVVVSGSAPVTVGLHTRSSQAVLIQDGGRTVLRVRKPMVIDYNTLFEITSSTTNTALGWVTKEDSEYEVRFPNDIQVRHKAAIIAACVYIDKLPSKRRRPAEGARRPSNTYVNYQDSLYNSLVTHTVFYNNST